MNEEQLSNTNLSNDDFSVLPEGFLVLDDNGKMFQVDDGDLKPFSSDTKIAGVVKTKNETNTGLMDTGMEEPMLQPPPLAVLKTTAAFYFHPDDEEEVNTLISKSLPQSSVRQFSVQKIVEKAEQNFGLKLGVEERKKFLQLILMAMRDRRSLPETEKLLADSLTPVGMGFPATLAGGIIVFVAQIKDKILKEGGLVVDETQVVIDSVVATESAKNVVTAKPTAIPVQAVNPVESKDAPVAGSANSQAPVFVPTLSTEEKPVETAAPIQPKKKSSVMEEIARQVREEMIKQGIKPPQEVKKPEPQNISNPPRVANDFSVSIDNINSSVVTTEAAVPKNVEEVVVPKRVVEDRPAPQNLSRFVNQARPAFNDIKMDNRSLGPIDELALMNLATFRRLSSDPAVASQKIGAIINSLGKQSLARKLQGIKAWHASPLYKKYLMIGQVGMETGTPIPNVINDLIAKEGDGLSMAEFEVIGDINRLIRI